jgi:hypothetical protein
LKPFREGRVLALPLVPARADKERSSIAATIKIDTDWIAWPETLSS